MTDFIVVDSQRCIACRTCEVACALAHSPPAPLVARHFHPRLNVNKLDNVSTPVMCHQCENAPCAAACPTAALTVGEQRIESDDTRCIGCASCVVACPFGCISIAGPDASGTMTIVKCDLCASRENGPACVDVCPTSALKKQSAGELALLGQQRRTGMAFVAGAVDG